MCYTVSDGKCNTAIKIETLSIALLTEMNFKIENTETFGISITQNSVSVNQ